MSYNCREAGSAARYPANTPISQDNSCNCIGTGEYDGLRKARKQQPHIALAQLLHKPGITAPIIGASKLLHLEQAVAAEEIELSDEAMNFLEEPFSPFLILGHD